MALRTVQGIAADLAAATSAGAASVSWLVTANMALQTIATLVAIVAGLYAIRWHRVRIANVTEKKDDD